MKAWRAEEQKYKKELELKRTQLTPQEIKDLETKLIEVQQKLGIDIKKKKEEEEAARYIPTFKSIDKVEKVGGKFVSNTALTPEQVNKMRKEKAEAAEKKRQEEKFSKFNNKLKEDKRRKMEQNRQIEE